MSEIDPLFTSKHPVCVYSLLMNCKELTNRFV